MNMEVRIYEDTKMPTLKEKLICGNLISGVETKLTFEISTNDVNEDLILIDREVLIHELTKLQDSDNISLDLYKFTRNLK